MHKLLSSPVRSFASCLLALLTHSAIRAGEGALDRNPGLYAKQLQPWQDDQHQDPLKLSIPSYLLDSLSLRGGVNPNNRRQKHVFRGAGQQSGGSGDSSCGASTPEAIEVSGAELSDSGSSGDRHRAPQQQQQQLDGIYLREWDVNGAPHYKRRSKRGSRSSPVHLFFTGNEWMLHLDVDANLDINHCLAYSEVPEPNPLKTTRKWAVRVGQAWVRRPHMRLAETSPDAEAKGSSWRSKEEGHGGINRCDKDSDGSGISVAAGAAAADGHRAAAEDMSPSRRLLPLYVVFVLDAVGLGVALPVLPFFVMGLKATALQLAIVVSSNYVAQTFGCIITGNMSDVMGRKPVVVGCLLGTVISHVMVARSTTLAGVAWGRIVGGVTGGLTPIAQAAVADVAPVQSLPKFLGRIQACVGLGFVLGPMTMTILHRLFKVSTGDTFYAAALFPLVGLFYAVFKMEETKSGETGISQMWKRRLAPPSSSSPPPSSSSHRSAADAGVEAERRPAKEARDRAFATRRRVKRHREGGGGGEAGAGGEERGFEEPQGSADVFEESFISAHGHDLQGYDAARDAVVDEIEVAPPGEAEVGKGVVDGAIGRDSVIPRAVMLLVGNGFLLMYAFSIETIYAMFLKDNFGYGESVLSMVFALNGVAVGALQLLGMRHLVGLLGKHMMLVTGNVFLAAGMIGVALSRNPFIHFALFTVHIMGYSLADTALVALISRYASPATQGRSLGLNQAAQSMARVISPVVAGILYELSKRRQQLPLGALPYLVGSIFPLIGVAVPFWLYLRSIEAKKRNGVYTRGGSSSPEGVASVGIPFESTRAQEIGHQKRL